ncbi:MAG: orotidine-5'-phosphate decarboxylase [Alphaproteobacteria bacterium]|nr:orotidine-5'-phosphate decarboxylase [Alphaproteobacteria bacterium]
MSRRCGLIVALDTPDVAVARRMAATLAPWCGLFKLGLEFFLANGPAGVREVGGRVFLDVKLHDIPNTVAGAVRSAVPLAPRMLTLHAAGGTAMIAAAVQAAATADADHRPLLLAVTVLTSIDAAALAAMGVAGGTRQQVLRLARLAVAAGVDGLVCAPSEVAMLRDALGEAPLLVVPGIRPAGAAAGDQARTATPAEAAAAGADWLVVGRPITGAPDPLAAAAAISAELA